MQEEDEGRDSGGYYEEEEAEGEPYEGQQAPDPRREMPDFTADEDISTPTSIPEEQTKPEPKVEESVPFKPGHFHLNALGLQLTTILIVD